MTDAFFRYSHCNARKVRSSKTYLTTSLGHDDNQPAIPNCVPSSSRLPRSDSCPVLHSPSRVSVLATDDSLLSFRKQSPSSHSGDRRPVVNMARLRVVLASFLPLLTTTESFVVRPSPPSNVFTTALQMGLFDGVKDAFSAPALERSILDAERETPIDRWMGWSVASENNRESKGQAMGTCGTRKGLVTSLTRKATLHVTHLKIPRLFPFVDQYPTDDSSCGFRRCHG